MLGVDAVAALAIFVVAYVLFALLERHRTVVAGLAAGSVLAAGLVAPARLLPSGYAAGGSVIEWNTLGLLVGLFLFAAVLGRLGLFGAVAERLASRWPGRPLRVLLVLTALSFLLSAFVNSITVLAVLAPVSLEVARRFGRSPAVLLVAEISASNVGGAATFVGDPPNVILGTFFHLGFIDFLLHTGPAALLGLAVVLLWFGWIGRRTWEAPGSPAVATAAGSAPEPGPRAYLALAAFAGTIAVLAVQGPLGVPVWLVGLAGGAVALAFVRRGELRGVLRGVDAETLLFFLFLFVLVGGLTDTGAIAWMAAGLAGAGGGNLLLTGTILLWTLALLSSVVDNVPLAAAAAPLIGALGRFSAAPLVYASALGTDIGGNGTPIGASANVVGLAAARREGVRIGWKEYLRLAFPAMLLTVAAANLVWLLLA